MLASSKSYNDINAMALKIPVGSNGISVLPFGNGAERMLNNKTVGAHFQNIDFNVHSDAHVLRAVQEGIAFSFKYGLDIMRSNGLQPSVIRAGKANMFLSEVFIDAFVNALNVPVELHESDGSVGAALGAGLGAGVYSSSKEAFSHSKALQVIEPGTNDYREAYDKWLQLLHKQLDEQQ